MPFVMLVWDPADTSHNPELELLRSEAEDNESEAEATESFWLSGLCVTQPIKSTEE